MGSRTPEEQAIINARQREQRKLNGNSATKKYEKTKKGFLMRVHRNMRSRAYGIQKRQHYLYSHIKEVIPREVFYEWSMGNPDFHALWDDYVASGHAIRLAPSVDRIDSSGDYDLANIRWITQSENSRLGAISQKRQRDAAKYAIAL